jgi:hypothetical protein
VLVETYNRRIFGFFDSQTNPQVLSFSSVEELVHYARWEASICDMIEFDYGKIIGIRFKLSPKGLFYLRDVVYVPWLMSINASIKKYQFSYRCLEELADRVRNCSLNFFIAWDIADPQGRDRSITSLRKLLVDELRKYTREQQGGMNEF